jgi:amino acid transporter
VPTIAIKATGVIALLLISVMQAWSSKAGTRAQLILTIFKVFALVLVFVGGLVFLGLGRAASSFDFNGTTSSPAGYALALFSALWTFDGWDQANYVARDCKTGSLPTIIHASLAMVVALFVGANVSYFLVLPFDVATATSTIGTSLCGHDSPSYGAKTRASR